MQSQEHTCAQPGVAPNQIIIKNPTGMEVGLRVEYTEPQAARVGCSKDDTLGTLRTGLLEKLNR